LPLFIDPLEVFAMKIITTVFLSSLALSLTAVYNGAQAQTLALADPTYHTPSQTLLSSSPNIDASIQGMLDGSSVMEVKALNAPPSAQTELTRRHCVRHQADWYRKGCQQVWDRRAKPSQALASPAYQQDVRAFRMASVNADDVTLGLPKRGPGPAPAASPPAGTPPVATATGVKRTAAKVKAEAAARAAVTLPVRRMVEYDYTPPAFGPAAFGVTFGGNADTVTAGGLLKLEAPTLTLGWGGPRIGALAIAEGEFAPGATRANVDMFLTLSQPVWGKLGMLLGAGPSFGGGKGGFGAGGGLLGGVSYDIQPGVTVVAYGKVTSERFDHAWQPKTFFGVDVAWSIPNGF
jgi:hypothetical protein